MRTFILLAGSLILKKRPNCVVEFKAVFVIRIFGGIFQGKGEYKIHKSLFVYFPNSKIPFLEKQQNKIHLLVSAIDSNL